MTNHRTLPILASLALTAAVLGACSPGSHSPTEPTLDFDSASKSMTASVSSDLGSSAGVDLAKSHGSDDGSGSANDDGTADQGGNNDDDGVADDRGGNGNAAANDDRGRHRRRGKDPAAEDQGRRNRGRGRGQGRGNDPQQPQQPRAGQEFEARVLSVNGNTITLAGGTRVVVNAQTTWAARGDLHSLADVAASLAANRQPRVEGRGTRQADGSIVAQTIKGEHLGD